MSTPPGYVAPLPARWPEVVSRERDVEIEREKAAYIRDAEEARARSVRSEIERLRAFAEEARGTGRVVSLHRQIAALQKELDGIERRPPEIYAQRSAIPSSFYGNTCTLPPLTRADLEMMIERERGRMGREVVFVMPRYCISPAMAERLRELGIDIRTIPAGLLFDGEGAAIKVGG